MSLFLQIEGAVTRLPRLIALIALVGLLALALATVLDVLLRWMFSAPISGLRDTYQLVVGVIIASCFALCTAQRGHITVRFLGRLLGTRWQYSLEAFGNLFTALVLAAITLQMWTYSGKIAMDGETTMILSWPLWPWLRAVSILFGFCVPVQFVVFLISAKRAVMGNSSYKKPQVSKTQAGENG